MTRASRIDIKKYANRRLYDITNSAYITLADLAEMVKSGQMVRVNDAKTGDDLTTSTLLHILIEQHQEGHETLSANALARLIACSTDNRSAQMASHLDKAIVTFDSNTDSPSDNARISEVEKALHKLTDAISRLKT